MARAMPEATVAVRYADEKNWSCVLGPLGAPAGAPQRHPGARGRGGAATSDRARAWRRVHSMATMKTSQADEGLSPGRRGHRS